MLRKSFKIVSATLTTVAGAGSLYFLHQNDYELSSIGLVRFSRAGITVVSFVYIWIPTLVTFSGITDDRRLQMELVRARTGQ